MNFNLDNLAASASPWQLNLFFIILTLWSLAWKGFALYHAARQEQKLWFVANLVVNTGGLLEIAYLFYLSKNKITVIDLQNYLKEAQLIKKRKLQSFKAKK